MAAKKTAGSVVAPTTTPVPTAGAAVGSAAAAPAVAATVSMSSALLALSASYTRELIAARARLDQLIGEAHWLTVGTYKEALVRRLLRERLPKRYEVGTGFVVARENDDRVLSRQLDVLVWDSSEHMPLFRDGDFVVIVPEACVAAIEVKGNLNKTELRSAIENLDSVARCFNAAFGSGSVRPSPPVRGIFAFKKPAAVKVPTTILDELGTYYAKDKNFTLASRLAYSEGRFNGDSWSLPWIDTVVVLGEESLMLERWTINGADEPVYAAFDTVQGEDAYGFLERQVMLRALAEGTGLLYRKPGAEAVLFGPERKFPYTRWMKASGAAVGDPIHKIGRLTPGAVAQMASLAYTAKAPRTRQKKKPGKKKGK